MGNRVFGWVLEVGKEEGIPEWEQELGEGFRGLVVWSSLWKVFGSFRMYLFLLPHTGGCGSIRDQKGKGLHRLRDV